MSAGGGCGLQHTGGVCKQREMQACSRVGEAQKETRGEPKLAAGQLPPSCRKRVSLREGFDQLGSCCGPPDSSPSKKLERYPGGIQS